MCFSSFSWVLQGHLAGSSAPYYPDEATKHLDQRAVDKLKSWDINEIFSMMEREITDQEHDLLESADIGYTWDPVEDFTPPSQQVLQDARRLIDDAGQFNQRVLVYCAAGWGRTGTVLASYLITRASDQTPVKVVDWLRTNGRPHSVETEDQCRALYTWYKSIWGKDPPEPLKSNCQKS